MTGEPIIWVPDTDDHEYEPDGEGWCVRCGGGFLDPLHAATQEPGQPPRRTVPGQRG
jgi:hypothetical protein